MWRQGGQMLYLFTADKRSVESREHREEKEKEQQGRHLRVGRGQRKWTVR